MSRNRISGKRHGRIGVFCSDEQKFHDESELPNMQALKFFRIRAGLISVACILSLTSCRRSDLPNIAASLHGVTSGLGGHLNTNELSSHWDVSLERAVALNDSDCGRLLDCFDKLPHHIHFGLLVDDVGQAPRIVNRIISHQQCTSLAVVCRNGTPSLDYFSIALPKNPVKVFIYNASDDFDESIVETLKRLHPAATFEVMKY